MKKAAPQKSYQLAANSYQLKNTYFARFTMKTPARITTMPT